MKTLRKRGSKQHQKPQTRHSSHPGSQAKGREHNQHMTHKSCCFKANVKSYLSFDKILQSSTPNLILNENI